MATAKYENFIPQNTAPLGTSHIEVYKSSGKKVGKIPLGHLRLPDLGEKLYSFGAISDVHIPVDGAEADLTRALDFYKGSGTDFVCICGDLTNNGTDAQFQTYASIVSNYSADMPVYAVTGNHETYTSRSPSNAEWLESNIESITGKPLYYSFTQGDDVFIMLGIKSEGALFTDEERTWFQQTLEANKNKRCFIFQHCLIGSGNIATCGNPYGMYNNQTWVNADGQAQMQEFEALLRQYPNTIWFHGHSHFKFRFQTADCKYANYDESRGYKNVHIPSVTKPRVEDGDDDGTNPDYAVDDSEGYLVDVYESGILLRGRDFAKGEWLPIATYWIEM
jgi:predicted phosphodiesterase